MLESMGDINTARERIAEIFRETKLWSPPFRGDPYHSASKKDVADLKDTAQTVASLLESFPTLAREKFGHPFLEGRMFGDPEGCYPLAFFAWSNQSQCILDRVYQLYPEALSQRQLRRSGLLDLQCDWMFAHEETLRWLLLHTETLQESIPYRLILYSQKLLPFETITILLQKTPALQDDRSSNQLANLLLARGYGHDVVRLVIDIRANSKCSPLALNTNGIAWDLDEGRANTIVSLLSQLDVVRLERLQWTTEGWTTVLEALPKCPGLQSVHLQLDASWLLQHQVAVKSLQLLLARESTFTGRLSIKLIGDPSLRQQEENGKLLQSILTGLASNPSRWPIVDTLDLSLITIETPILSKLETFVKSLSLHHVRLVAVNSTIEDQCPSFWNAVAQLDARNIERHMAFPGTKDTTLSALHIDNGHWQRRGGGQVIVTDVIVSILEHESIQDIRINLPRHAFDVEDVCDALKENRSLQNLSLMNMDFLNEDCKTLPVRIFSVLEKKNVTLHNLTIFNRQHALTLTDRPHPVPVDIPTAERIEHLLLLNQYGRPDMLTNSTTKPKVIALLEQVQNLEGSSSKESRPSMSERLSFNDFHPTEEKRELEPLQELTSRYQCLLKSVDHWCQSRRQGAKEQSILYGLLREHPDLWCLP